MKSTVFLLFTLLSFSFFSSCTKSNTETQLPKIIIGSANLYGNGSEGLTKQNIMIYDSVAWSDLLTKLNSSNNVSDEFTQTNIDFSSFTVIAVFDKVLGNSGNSVSIVDVFANVNNVTVKLKYDYNTGVSPTVITQPFQIVKVPVLDKKKPVIFE